VRVRGEEKKRGRRNSQQNLKNIQIMYYTIIYFDKQSELFYFDYVYEI